VSDKEQVNQIVDYYLDHHPAEFKDGEEVGAMVTRHLKRITNAVGLALNELEAMPGEAYPYPSAVKRATAILKEARRPPLPPTVAVIDADTLVWEVVSLQDRLRSILRGDDDE